MYRTIRFSLLIVLVGAIGAAAALGLQFTSEEIEEEGYVVWDGEPIVFEKADGANPNRAENQDRITESVWLTRSNRGGQIYNAVERNRPSQTESPVGTLWAVGTTDELTELTFSPFREAVGKPRDVVGKELVLFIPEEGVFIDVVFTSWSRQKRGGFAYERSTP
jgi:hypothetical protein